MGWPGFQVSGDGVQIGFQDFKVPHGFISLEPSEQEPRSRAEGSEVGRSARVQGRLAKPVLFGSSTPI